MTDSRIYRLLYILMNEVEDEDSFADYIEEYKNEIDNDFFRALIQNIIVNGDDEEQNHLALFLSAAGRSFFDALDIDEELATKLTNKIVAEVTNEDELNQFINNHIQDCDHVFFIVFLYHALTARKESDGEVDLYFEIAKILFNVTENQRAAGFVQIILDDVSSQEDLARFVESYIDQCDSRFFDVLQYNIEQFQEQDDTKIAEFLQQVGVMLKDAIDLNRPYRLMQFLLENINHLDMFVKEFGDELDDNFFAVMENYIDQLREDDHQEQATYLWEVKKQLQQVVQDSQQESSHLASQQGYVDVEGKPAGVPTSISRGSVGTGATEHVDDVSDEDVNIDDVLNQVYEFLSSDAEAEVGILYQFISKLLSVLPQCTLEELPKAYIFAHNSLAEMHWQLAFKEEDEKDSHLYQAIQYYQKSLEGYSEEDVEQYATVYGNIAEAYWQLAGGDRDENLRQAIDYYERVLSVITLEDHLEIYGRTMANLAGTYLTLSDGDFIENHQKGIQLLNELLQKAPIKDEFPERYTRIHNMIASAYLELDHLQDAIAHYKEVLQMYDSEETINEYASTEINIGVCYARIGDEESLKEAIPHLEKAVSIYTKDAYPEGYAVIENNLGEVHRNLARYNPNENLEKARQHYENALQVWTQDQFPESYAKVQQSMATLYFKLPPDHPQRDLMKAIEFYQNALAFYTSYDLSRYAALQRDLGMSYFQLSEGFRVEFLQLAIDSFQKLVSIPRIDEYEPYDQALGFHYLGVVYESLSIGDRAENLKRSIEAYQKALAFYNQKDYPDEFASTCLGLGVAYAELSLEGFDQRLLEAIDHYENALQVYTFHAGALEQGKDKPHAYAGVLDNLAIAYANLPAKNRLANLEKAIGYHQEAANIFINNGYLYDGAIAKINLGLRYTELAEYDHSTRDENLQQAIECYDEALQTITITEFPSAYAKAQHNLASAYFQLSEVREDTSLSKRAIACYENARQVFTPDAFPQEYVNCRYGEALAYHDGGDDETAYDILVDAIDILENRVRAVSSVGTRRVISEKNALLYQLLVSVCVALGRIEDAFRYAERGKSRTLIEMLNTTNIPPSKNVSEDLRDAFLKARQKMIELQHQQQHSKKQIKKELEILPDDERGGVSFQLISADVDREDIGEELDAVRKEYHDLLAQIQKQDPEFVAVERVAPLTFADIEAMIPEKTLFVECFTTFDGTYIFVNDGKENINDTHLLLKDLTVNSVLDLLEKDWLNPYFNSDRQDWLNTIENTSQILAERFWQAEDEHGVSLAKLVGKSDVERLVFLPHGGLHLLPLHLIPLEEGRLIDRFEIAYSPSATFLRFALNRDRNDLDHFFAVANPDQTLTFADSEVKNISAHFSEKTILWHEEATKNAIYDHAPNAHIVHFSCHGSFRYGNPLESRLLLMGDDLTLNEIFTKVKLPKVSAVVLSACETGMIQLERGDEYIGLPSGFMYAGSPSVISSLWAVNDLSTALLVDRWYENVIEKNMGKAAALREAQQWIQELTHHDLTSILDKPVFEERVDSKMRRKYSRQAKLTPDKKPFAHPYFWGAFVCTGDWN